MVALLPEHPQASPERQQRPADRVVVGQDVGTRAALVVQKRFPIDAVNIAAVDMPEITIRRMAQKEPGRGFFQQIDGLPEQAIGNDLLLVAGWLFVAKGVRRDDKSKLFFAQVR